MNSATPQPAPPSPPPDARELDYAAAPNPRTRWARLLVLVLLAAVIAWLMPRMWTEFGYRVGRRDFERDLLTFSAPPGTVAYIDGQAAAQLPPALAAALDPPRNETFLSTEVRRSGRSRGAPTWQSWYSFPDYSGNTETTLFLHERRTPSGKRRLVAIAAITHPHVFTPSGPPGIACRVAVAEPATMLTPSSTRPSSTSRFQLIGRWPKRDHSLRFDVGQPDPSDPSKFTIDYSIADGRGTIDGALNDDDTVTLIVRDGPMRQ